MLHFLKYFGIACIGVALPLSLFPSFFTHAPKGTYVSATTQDSGFVITPFLLTRIAKEYKSKQEFSLAIRRLIISKMISDGYAGFATTYPGYTLTLAQQGETYIGTGNSNAGLDQLDFWIKKNIIPKGSFSGHQFTTPIFLSAETYHGRQGIELFQSKKDLEQLGYQVVSYRTRKNNDPAYRRNNIKQTFDTFGNIRVINAGEKISFSQNIGYDPTQQKNYQEGKVIKDDKEIPEYGGGICGGSTAMYQGMVTNASLVRLQVRNHSKWYHALYSAYINGTRINTPGIDSTIYNSSPDLVFQNISTHPILVLANYDGSLGGEEQNFTLGFTSDKGNLTYIGAEAKNFIIDGKKRKGKCYTRNINGSEKKSCYNQLK